MKQVSKKTVNYRQAKGKRDCGNCAMFHPILGTCDLVRGKIRATDICNKWVKK